MGNLKSSGQPDEISLLGEPVAKHPEGGPNSQVDSWSSGTLQNTLQKHKAQRKVAQYIQNTEGQNSCSINQKEIPGTDP